MPNPWASAPAADHAHHICHWEEMRKLAERPVCRSATNYWFYQYLLLVI